MIKLPDEKQAMVEWLNPQITELENICDEIPFGLDEDDAMQLKVMRFALDSLNATAQPVSGGRTMREHEFSQLVNELRDVPAIQSKREKIVGILKAFNIRPAAPGGQDD